MKRIWLLLVLLWGMGSSLYAVIDWTATTRNAEFTPRNIAASVFYDSRIWVFAGDGAYADAFKDVWYSYSGVDWYAATLNAAFGRRFDLTALSFGSKLWVIAGSDNNDYSGTLARKDAWWSTNGADWTAATKNAEFGSRYKHLSIVFDSKMWVICGYENGDLSKSVYSSTDGVEWTENTGAAEFNYNVISDSCGVTVFDSKIWVNEPEGGGVWYSADGVEWTRAGDLPEFETGETAKIIAFDGVLYLVGSKGTVWYSPDGTSWAGDTTGTWPERARWNIISISDEKMGVLNGYVGSTYYKDFWLGRVLAASTSTVSPTRTVTPYHTRTITPTFTPTFTRTATNTITPTYTPTFTRTPTFTLTTANTKTFTPTVTPTHTFSPTFTVTQTITETWTVSPTFTVTSTVTETLTPTPVETVIIWFNGQTGYGYSKDVIVSARQYPDTADNPCVYTWYITNTEDATAYEHVCVTDIRDDINAASNVRAWVFQSLTEVDCYDFLLHVTGGDLGVDFWSNTINICPQATPTAVR